MRSNGTTLWVLHFQGGAYAYALAAGTRSADEDLATVGNWSSVGLWSDGETFWVSDGGDRKAFAYDANGARDADQDLDTLRPAGNRDPAGLWSDDGTRWVADSADRRIYAYDLAAGTRSVERELAVEDNLSPMGIWSDGRRCGWGIGRRTRCSRTGCRTRRRRRCCRVCDPRKTAPSGASRQRGKSKHIEALVRDWFRRRLAS